MNWFWAEARWFATRIIIRDVSKMSLYFAPNAPNRDTGLVSDLLAVAERVEHSAGIRCTTEIRLERERSSQRL